MPGIAYLGGPVAGLDYQGATSWRQTADEFLRPRGITTLSPLRGIESLYDVEQFTKYGYAGNPLTSESGIFTRDRHDVRQCDVIVINFQGAKKVSIGSIWEMALAHELNKPIVLIIEPEGNPNDHMFVRQAAGYTVGDLQSGLMVVSAILTPGI